MLLISHRCIMQHILSCVADVHSSGNESSMASDRCKTGQMLANSTMITAVSLLIPSFALLFNPARGQSSNISLPRVLDHLLQRRDRTYLEHQTNHS